MKINKAKLQLAMARSCMNWHTLAAAADVSEATLKKANAGNGVRPATLGKIAKALNVDPTDIMEEV